MPNIEDWLQRLTVLRQRRSKEDEMLLQVEGQMEFIENNAPKDSPTRALAVILNLLVKEIRISDADNIFLLETFLTLLSEQQKEIDMLKATLTSDYPKLSKKVEEMEAWRQEREPILKHLREYLRESEDFLGENK
jgi:septal ring factor EnvC (AmiA/AmiB activator)